MAKLTAPVKMGLLLISTYGFEGVSNQFKPQALATQLLLRDYLYFTNIALFYTLFAVILGLLRRYNKQAAAVHRFSVVTALVLEIIVTVSFWILFSINPALVKNKPPQPDAVLRVSPIEEIPKHLLPTIILLIEQRGLYVSRGWSHRIFFISFCFIYYLVSEMYYRLKQAFLYPFFKFFNGTQRFLFFCAMAAIALLIYEASMIAKTEPSSSHKKQRRPRKRTAAHARNVNKLK